MIDLAVTKNLNCLIGYQTNTSFSETGYTEELIIILRLSTSPKCKVKIVLRASAQGWPSHGIQTKL